MSTGSNMQSSVRRKDILIREQLFLAVRRQDYKQISVYLSSHDLCFNGEGEQPPLIFSAIETGSIPFVAAVLATKKVEPCKRNEFGETAYQFALRLNLKVVAGVVASHWPQISRPMVRSSRGDLVAA